MREKEITKAAQEAETPERSGDIGSYKCSGCGGNMNFDAEAGALKCPYCGNEIKLEYSADVSERDFSELTGAEKWKDGVKQVTCSNCGANEVYNADEVAKVCPFCGSPMVLSLEDISGIKPNVVIPFAINKDAASGFCLKWIKRRIFAPSKYKKSVKIHNLNGIYVPAWTFDCQTVTAYAGILGKTVTKTRVRNGKSETYTTTEYFPVSGTIFNIFDDIVISGTTLVEDKYFKTFNVDQKRYVKYDDRYLAGYSANSYSVEPLDAWMKAEVQIKDRIKNDIVNKHHADTVKTLNMNVMYEGKSFKYLLIPLYVSATKYKDRLFSQYVHGTTGKVSGRTPISPLRVVIAVLLGLGLVGLIAWLLMTYNDVNPDFFMRFFDVH